MTKLPLLLVTLGACAVQHTTPLSSLEKPEVEIVSRGQLAIELHVGSVGGCPLLGEEARATFDGQDMYVARGGYASDSNGCYPIGFWFTPQADANAMLDFERTTSSSALQISDATATWHVDGHPLLSNKFVDDPAHSRIVWQDVAGISTARIYPEVPIKIAGNAITYPAGTSVSWVDAIAHPTATLCDGPDLCTIYLEGERDFNMTSP